MDYGVHRCRCIYYKDNLAIDSKLNNDQHSLECKYKHSLLLLLEFTENSSRRSVRIPSQYDGALPYLSSPRVHAYDLSAASPVGVPFMMVDWVDGTPLPLFTDIFSTSEKFQILHNLSDIILDLVCPLNE
jgi:hypothetical protein